MVVLVIRVMRISVEVVFLRLGSPISSSNACMFSHSGRARPHVIMCSIVSFALSHILHLRSLGSRDLWWFLTFRPLWASLNQVFSCVMFVKVVPTFGQTILFQSSVMPSLMFHLGPEFGGRAVFLERVSVTFLIVSADRAVCSLPFCVGTVHSVSLG